VLENNKFRALVRFLPFPFMQLQLTLAHTTLSHYLASHHSHLLTSSMTPFQFPHNTVTGRYPDEVNGVSPIAQGLIVFQLEPSPHPILGDYLDLPVCVSLFPNWSIVSS
jgi:hypothetical protein